MSDLITSVIAKVKVAQRSLGEGIGGLELIAREDDRSLLTGYTGSAAMKELRDALKRTEHASELLASLNTAEVARR